MNITKKLIGACGGGVEVGNRLSVTRQAVNYWVSNNRVPAKYVEELCKMSEHRFKPIEIRPDLYTK